MKSDGSKRFKSGFLTYLPDKQVYQLTLERVDKPTLTLVGKFADNKLELEGSAEHITYKLVFTIPNESRFLYAVSLNRARSAPTVKTRWKSAIPVQVSRSPPSRPARYALSTADSAPWKSIQGKTITFAVPAAKKSFEARPGKVRQQKGQCHNSKVTVYCHLVGITCKLHTELVDCFVL